MRVRPPRALGPALGLALALAACGPAPADDGIASAGGAATGAAATPSASVTVDRQEAQLKFAQCMREHGIDMPDPAPGQGIQIKIKPGQEKALEEAHKACEEFAPGRKP